VAKKQVLRCPVQKLSKFRKAMLPYNKPISIYFSNWLRNPVTGGSKKDRLQQMLARFLRDRKRFLRTINRPGRGAM